MFTSLSQFYNSDTWRTFRAGLINERTDAQGNLYDELNGELLLKAYDIVLHHKIPLTMQNVNDFDISLNRENIMVVSQRSHNEIHKRFGYTAQRKVYLVYGAPCSGKTTFVNNIKGNSDLIVDIDNIWQCITGGARYDKPAALKQVAFTMRDALMDCVKRRVGKWERAFIVTGGAVESIRQRQIEDLGAEPIFIDTDKETCYKNLANDRTRSPEQKTEWQKYIDQWFNDYTGQ